MESLNNLLEIFREPLLQFFVWVAVIYIIANIFVDRKLAFWIAFPSATYLWVKKQEPYTALKAWLLVAVVILVVWGAKYLFNLNVLLLLKGKKRCPTCCEEAYRKAKVCPHCGYNFLSEADECKN